METPKLLQQLLETVTHLSQQFQQAHWNIEGVNFSDLHGLFGDLYDEVQESIDPIAEDIRKLSVYVEYGPDVVTRSQLVNLQTTGKLDQILPTLINNNEMVLSLLKQALKVAREESVYDVENYLAERISQHNKHAWMLKSMEK
jgi:starvation-inducible DNA-binding protein